MREPANMHKLALAALGAALLIPAGLAGILAGMDEINRASIGPAERLGDLITASINAAQALAPWCQGLIYLLFGLALNSAAILLLARGLQSIRS